MNFKNILLDFFKSKKTMEDANEIIKKHLFEYDYNLLEVLRFMTIDNKVYPETLIKYSRNLVLHILKSENIIEIETLDLYKKYIKEKESYYKNFEKKDINHEEVDFENYWITIYNDMENHSEYDEPIKILILIREKMLEFIKKDSKFNIDTLNDFFNLEYIGENLYNKRYIFYGLFEYICNFLENKITNHDIKNIFIDLKNKFIKNIITSGIELNSCSNKTTLELIKFLSIHFFLFIDL